MKKDITRDYITEAFRTYALCGRPSISEATISADLNIELGLKTSDSVSDLCEDNTTAVDFDNIAVGKAIVILNNTKPYIVAAVENIYFVDPHKPLRKGDISFRVQKFACDYNADARTVYRWLKEARQLCAHIRGLRTI